MSSTDARLQLLTTEYQQLKSEQTARISARDGLVYTTLGAIVAVLAASSYLGRLVILVLPLVCVALGWTHLVNDQKVSAIGRYLREDLAPRLSAIAEEPVLGWETMHRSDRRRRSRKHAQLAINLIVFVVPALVAAAAAWWIAPHVLTATVSLVEIAAVAGYGWQVISYADHTA